MSPSDDKRRTLEDLHAEIGRFYRQKRESDAEKEARGVPSAHQWVVSVDGVLNALAQSNGTFLQHAPVVVHGDLVTARRVVIRVAQPSLPLREEEVSILRTTAYTGKEARDNQARLEEMTGRKLAGVFADSAALAAELGEGHVVVTAPSPNTHDMPQDARDGGDSERWTNARRHIETIKTVAEFTAEQPKITLLFDNPDPRIAERILTLVAEAPEIRDAIDEVVVVDGEPLETQMIKEQAVSLPADLLNRFRLSDVSLNARLNKYSSVPQAKRQPLIAVPEAMTVRVVATDGATDRLEPIVRSLWTPRVATEPSTAAPQPGPPENSPLTEGQRRLLAALQEQGVTYVVTGPVALRLHAYAAGVETPWLFSPQYFPGIELALEPESGNVRQGLQVLRSLVSEGLAEPLGPPIPEEDPPRGQTANIINLKPGDPAARAFALISYGTSGPGSYFPDKVHPYRTVVGELEIPVSPVLETVAAIHQGIEAGMQANAVGAQGILTLNQLTLFVKAIERPAKNSLRPLEADYPNRRRDRAARRAGLLPGSDRVAVSHERVSELPWVLWRLDYLDPASVRTGVLGWCWGVEAAQWSVSNSAGGISPISPWSRRWLNQSVYSATWRAVMASPSAPARRKAVPSNPVYASSSPRLLREMTGSTKLPAPCTTADHSSLSVRTASGERTPILTPACAVPVFLALCRERFHRRSPALSLVHALLRLPGSSRVPERLSSPGPRRSPIPDTAAPTMWPGTAHRPRPGCVADPGSIPPPRVVGASPPPRGSRTRRGCLSVTRGRP